MRMPGNFPVTTFVTLPGMRTRVLPPIFLTTAPNHKSHRANNNIGKSHKTILFVNRYHALKLSGSQLAPVAERHKPRGPNKESCFNYSA